MQKNAEDLDIAMPMYNLLEHSDNYSMTSEGLCNCYREKQMMTRVIICN